MIFITSPSKQSVDAALKEIARPFFWTWIGEGPFNGLDSAAGGTKLDLQPSIKRFSYELRQPYIDYIGELAATQPPDWWRTSVSEKNPYISQTFFWVCCIKACLERLAADKDQIQHFFVVQDAALRGALSENLKATGYSVSLFDSVTERWSAVIRRVTGVFAYQAYFAFKHAVRIGIARFCYRLHRRKPLHTLLKANASVCVTNIWIDLRAYSPQTGEFKDVDFSGVAQFLRSRGKTVVGLANILDSASYRKVAEYIAHTDQPFLVPHSFLTLTDIPVCLWRSSLQFPRRNEYPDFAGVKISGLIFSDLQQEWYTQREADHALVERWTHRVKQAGFQIEKFIYTFENHTWERVICNSLRIVYPGIKLIGYQPNGLPLLLMNHFITASESYSVPLPDRIVANGQYAAQILSSSGLGSKRVVLGGGLRQSYLQTLLYGAESVSVHKSQPSQILVTPSIGRHRTVELILKVVKAFQALPDLKITIKCHPAIRFERLKAFLGPLQMPGNISISTETIFRLLPETDVLIYNDGTFPAAEALAFGIPVIFVEPEFGLSLDSLDGFPDARRTARTPEEIRSESLMALSSRDQERPRSDALSIIRQLVGPVGEKTFQLFAD